VPAAPKRRPGDPNPEVRPVVNPLREAGGRGNDYGIARGIVALLSWLKRRKASRDGGAGR